MLNKQMAPYMFSEVGGITDALWDMHHGRQRYPLDNLLVNKENSSAIIEIAVAGFSPNEISIVEEENRLIVEGSTSENVHEEGWVYLKKDIAGRSFKKVWNKRSTLKVEAAEFDNGILRITLSRDENKVKKIPVLTKSYQPESFSEQVI